MHTELTDIAWTALLPAFGWASFAYLIFTLQVFAGMPPFYRHWNEWTMARDEAGAGQTMLFAISILFGVGLALPLLLVVMQNVSFLLVGAAWIWGGWRVRRDLRDASRQPLPWVTPVGFFGWSRAVARWPMLVFDLWTVSLSLLSFVLLLNAWLNWSD